VARTIEVAVAHVELEDGQARRRRELAQDLLLLQERAEVVVLTGLAGHREPFLASRGEGLGPPRAQDDVEADRLEPRLEPAEVLVAAAVEPLPGHRREVE